MSLDAFYCLNRLLELDPARVLQTATAQIAATDAYRRRRTDI